MYNMGNMMPAMKGWIFIHILQLPPHTVHAGNHVFLFQVCVSSQTNTHHFRKHAKNTAILQRLSHLDTFVQSWLSTHVEE